MNEYSFKLLKTAIVCGTVAFVSYLGYKTVCKLAQEPIRIKIQQESPLELELNHQIKIQQESPLELELNHQGLPETLGTKENPVHTIIEK